MLHKIRKTTDSLIFKAFLLVVAVALIWSYRDVIGGIGDKNIVSFKEVNPIKLSEFNHIRSKERIRLQRTEGVNFTDEQIDNMNISASVLQKLIVERLIKFLSLKYNLDFSDAAIADAIRKLPVFRDSEGRFEMERFKSFLRMNYLTEEEYFQNEKDYLSQTILFGGFVGNFYVPNSRIKNIVDFMSEKRIVDIAILPLTSPRVSNKNPGESELKNFYDENKDLFKTPWSRDICYISIQHNQKNNDKIKVDASEIKDFYEENKSEFKGRSFAQASAEIKKYLLKEKFDYWVGEITKALDDDVAGGMNLVEISSKHNLSMQCEKNISEANISKKASGLFAPFLADVKEMSEGEVSYPADLEDGGVVLFEVTKYSPEKFEEYKAIKDKVTSKYNIFYHRQEKIKSAHDFAGKVDYGKFVSNAKAKGMNLRVARSFVRINASDMTNYPASMLKAIFESDKDSVIGPFIDKDKAYICVIRNITKDQSVKKDMLSQKGEIASSIKEGFRDELIDYARIESDMKVRVDSSILK